MHCIAAYIYGSVSILVVSLMSLGGVGFLPIIRSKSRQRWFHALIALAVATMCTDAALHIIPKVITSNVPNFGQEGCVSNSRRACPTQNLETCKFV